MPITAPQQEIRRLLAQTLAAGRPSEATAGSVAEAAVRAWVRAASELTPLVGAEGTRALYARCVALARDTSPWLPLGDIDTSLAKSLADLRASLESRKASEATDASTAFLGNLTRLLGTMIGEGLTLHLLSSAWGQSVPDPMTEEGPK